MIITTPPLREFIMHRLALAIIKLCTKFKVHSLTRFKYVTKPQN